MAKILVNTVNTTAGVIYAGSLISPEEEPLVTNAGGTLIATGNADLDTAAERARQSRISGAPPAVADGIMATAYTTRVGISQGGGEDR